MSLDAWVALLRDALAAARAGDWEQAARLERLQAEAMVALQLDPLPAGGTEAARRHRERLGEASALVDELVVLTRERLTDVGSLLGSAANEQRLQRAYGGSVEP